MPGLERKAAAKVVDVDFSTAAVAETRGGGGEGGERRQRARGVGDNRVDEDWEAGTKEAFARDGGTSRGRRQPMAAAENGVEEEGGGRRCWAWMQGRRRRRGHQEIRKEGDSGSASAASRRKQRRRKRPRSMAAMTSWEGGTGGLMKTEMRPTATEKSEGREDPHVVGDGKEEEDTAAASRMRKAVGFAVTAVKEEKAMADGGGRGRRGRRDKGVAGGREGEEGGAEADGNVRRQRAATLEVGEITEGGRIFFL